MCETRRVGAVNGSIARRFDMPAIQLCDLPVDLLLTILVSCGPVATAHVSMLLPVLVRAQIDGRRLVDAIAVSFICTFSDALSCEYDARWPWLYHAARLMGLLPNKPHPVWLLNTAADVPRVPPSWFMRAVFCQEAPYAVRTGFPIDLAVLRKMYAIFGMPYTDAAHSKPAWLRFNADRRFPVISGCDNDWSMELLASRELLGRFLDDLGQLLDSFQQIISSVFKTKRGGQHVSPAVFDAALSSWTSNAEGTSPWLLELKKGHGSEDDDSDDDGDSYKLETEDEDEVEEEYELEEEYEVEEEEKEEHDHFNHIPDWDGPNPLCRLVFCQDEDPTCCHGPCRCTLIGPLSCGDRVLASERRRAGRRVGRYWDDDLRLARFLANPTCEQLSYYLDDGSDAGGGVCSARRSAW